MTDDLADRLKTMQPFDLACHARFEQATGLSETAMLMAVAAEINRRIAPPAAPTGVPEDDALIKAHRHGFRDGLAVAAARAMRMGQIILARDLLASPDPPART